MKLKKQFKDFYDEICIHGESEDLKEKRDILQSDIEDYFPMLPDRISNKNTFMLHVRGESMINAGILDGDFVLVEQSAVADNGDIVVALLEDSATVKRFYKEEGIFRLQPENDALEPIIVRDLQIMGKVIGVFRFF